MFSMDRAVQVLSLCGAAPLSVSQIGKMANGNHQRLFKLITELEERGLLMGEYNKQGRGRPSHMLRTTSLGKRFLDKCRALQDLSIHANDNDIKRACHQADLANQLEERGMTVYSRFQEVNELARNIADTA